LVSTVVGVLKQERLAAGDEDLGDAERRRLARDPPHTLEA
jgi:hypothetical protein